MSDPRETQEPGVPADLHRIASLLRQAKHLEPDAQRALAELVDELGRNLETGREDDPHAAQLATTTATLLQALVHKRDPGLLPAARDRLEQAILSAETQAPMAAGIAQRLLDVLSGIGI
jgi:hypothetical protein